MTAPDLAHVALVVNEPAASAAIFERDFGLLRREFSSGGRAAPAISVGTTTMALFQPGDPFLGPGARKGVHDIATAVPNPVAATRNSGLATVNDASEGLGGRTQVELAPDRTCGVRVRFTESLGLAPPSFTLVERIDHLGIASDDNDAGVRVFVDNLGCPLDSTQTDVEVRVVTESFISDKYNLVYHSR